MVSHDIQHIMPGTLLPSHFSLHFSIRPNVIAFPKYQTTTSDHEKARSSICLDANENSAGSCLVPVPRYEPCILSAPNHGTPQEPIGLKNLHRYPSASQASLRRQVAQWRGLECRLCFLFLFLIIGHTEFTSLPFTVSPGPSWSWIWCFRRHRCHYTNDMHPWSRQDPALTSHV